MKIIFLIFFSINLFSFKLFAQSIVVVNIQKLIDNNTAYIQSVNELENLRQDRLNKIKKKEEELEKILLEIEESKMILKQEEINLQIDKYNNKLNDYSAYIDEFNFHFQNQIINMREKVLKEIIVLLENYARKNKIDLILDSTSYLIASNSIDITESVNIELENINLKLEYKDFE